MYPRLMAGHDTDPGLQSPSQKAITLGSKRPASATAMQVRI